LFLLFISANNINMHHKTILHVTETLVETLTSEQIAEIQSIRYEEAALQRSGNGPHGIVNANKRLREWNLFSDVAAEIRRGVIDRVSDIRLLYDIDQNPLIALPYAKGDEFAESFIRNYREALIDATEHYGSGCRRDSFLETYLKTLYTKDHTLGFMDRLPEDSDTIRKTVIEGYSYSNSIDEATQKVLQKIEEIRIQTERLHEVHHGIHPERLSNRAGASFARGVAAMETGHAAQGKQPTLRHQRRTGENAPIGHVTPTPNGDET
jgi:hypothetical protein